MRVRLPLPASPARRKPQQQKRKTAAANRLHGQTFQTSARSQVDKATVCKTVNRRFESGRALSDGDPSQVRSNLQPTHEKGGRAMYRLRLFYVARVFLRDFRRRGEGG